MMMHKYFYIPRDKEFHDNNALIEKIKEEHFVDRDTIIVNAMPDYSSVLCQYANHKLSIFNDYDLLHQISLELPYPTMSQVTDRETGEVESFDRYLSIWAQKYIIKGYRYLVLTSDIRSGKALQKVNSYFKSKLDPEAYSYAATYVEELSAFKPNTYVEQYNSKIKGNILYQWENAFNPNWNY